MQAVRAIGLHKQFGTTRAVAGVDLEVHPGELFTLLGPSGCGKTTLLRLLAGLEEATAGEILFGGARVDQTPAHKRNVGMVFQNYALFPHMSVEANVAYGLKARGVGGQEIAERVAESLAAVGLADYGDRAPGQLSGGQQQRVALARALVTRPALLLMDEPLSNLDARLRVAMRMEVRRIVKSAGITTVYVTHDQEEALAISDRIGVMEAGRLIQVASPVAIYRRPAHKAVAAFVGSCSFLAARLNGRVLEVAGQYLTSWVAQQERAVTIGIRPEHLHIHSVQGAPAPGHLSLVGSVVGETYLGAASSLEVRLDSGEVLTVHMVEEPGAYPAGTRVRLEAPTTALLLFDRSTGEALV